VSVVETIASSLSALDTLLRMGRSGPGAAAARLSTSDAGRRLAESTFKLTSLYS
jgi:hypothetical protein